MIVVLRGIVKDTPEHANQPSALRMTHCRALGFGVQSLLCVQSGQGLFITQLVSYMVDPSGSGIEEVAISLMTGVVFGAFSAL